MAKAIASLSPLSAFKRHFGVALSTFLTVAVGGTAISLAIAPRYYETSARLMVGQKEVGISTLGQALTEANTQVPGRAADPVATQAELVQSQAVLRRALNAYAKQHQLDLKDLPSVGKVQQGLEIDIIPATNVLEVSYQDKDPDRAAGLLNAIIQAAVQESQNVIRSEAATLREFLEKKIPEQRTKLNQAEAAERQYRQAHGIVSLDTQTESLVTSTAALEDEERKLRGQLQESATRNSLLQRVTGMNTPGRAYTAVRIGQDETLKELEKQLTSLEVTLVDARSRLGDQHPDLLALLQKREELRQLYSQRFAQAAGSPDGSTNGAGNSAGNPLSQDLISRYLVGEIEQRAMSSRLTAVQQDLNQLRSRLAQASAYEQPLIALAREREEAANSLNLLRNKLEEVKIAEGQILSNMRVIGSAEVPENPVSPKPLAVLVLSTVAGIILAAALILLLERLNPTFRHANEAEAVLDQPVLAELPKFMPITLNPLEIEQFLDDPDCVEPYRILLKTLEALSNQMTPVVVFSSIAPGEGKSAVTLQLATVAAMLSRRTLLIDADLRHPVHHFLLNVAAYPGLTQVVQGEISLRDAVQPTFIENLSVLTYGEMPSRPSAIIEAPTMNALIAEASAHYDCVIIDASPIGICADATALRQAANGLVLVMQRNRTHKEALLHAIDTLQRSGTNPLGLVMSETVLPIETEPPTLNPPTRLPIPVPPPIATRSTIRTKVRKS